jgi:LmbE family N-acetylglucosaminyl deacetylase
LADYHLSTHSECPKKELTLFSRCRLRQLYHSAIYRLVCEFQEEQLSQPAVIFAPHPDDETLGCGGTIIKKKQIGAEVKIIFMTDGSRSHKELMPREVLKSIRASEALRAGHILGVSAQDMTFLEYGDGNLKQHQETAARDVIKLLHHYQPQQIFVPYHREWLRDHPETNQIVQSALKEYNRRVLMCEYPIWFWLYWPLVNIPTGTLFQRLNAIRTSISSSTSLLKDFRHGIYISDILEIKQNALAQHKSQMTQLIPDPRWRTLKSISNGEFIECFFQNYEIFHCYSHPS